MPGRWQERAACSGLPLSTFFPPSEDVTTHRDERQPPPPELVRLCGGCPVKSDCLFTALTKNEVGIWAGTTYAQRRALKRCRFRHACVACASVEVVAYRGMAVCMSCAVSWRVPVSAVPAPTSPRSPMPLPISRPISRK